MVTALYAPDGDAILLENKNRGERLRDLHIIDAYSGERTIHTVEPRRETLVRRFRLERSHGWYEAGSCGPAYRYRWNTLVAAFIGNHCAKSGTMRRGS